MIDIQRNLPFTLNDMETEPHKTLTNFTSIDSGPITQNIHVNHNMKQQESFEMMITSTCRAI